MNDNDSPSAGVEGEIASKCQGLLRVLLLILAWGASEAATAGRPEAALGYLDLSEHDFDRGVVQLRGEWEFYWARFLIPADFRAPDPPVPDGHIRVPGAWNGFLVDGKPLDGRGYGTYRLIVRLPAVTAPGSGAPDPGPPGASPGGFPGASPTRAPESGPVGAPSSGQRALAIHIPWTYSAYALWINGIPLAANGAVGTSPAQMKPQFLPVTVPFYPEGETLELIVHVSNFHHRNGGIWHAPLMGAYERIARRQVLRLAVDTMLAGAILFMGIYHLVIFAGFKERRASLYLGVTCLAGALRTLLTGEHVLDQITGGLPWILELKLEYLTGYLLLASIYTFMRWLFPAETPRAAVWAAWLVAVLGGFITLVSSTYVASLAIPYYLGIVALFGLTGAVIFITAAVRRREGARLTLGGGIALVVAVCHDMFHYNLRGAGMHLIPLGLFALLLFQSMALGRRFALAFRREVALSAENAELLNTVKAQLEEVQRSRRIIAAADEELRKNIAERLHGRVQTRLLAVWHRLGLLRDALPEEARTVKEFVEELRGEIDRLREVEIRQVSHLLHPSIVRVGLVPAVESLAREFQGAFDIRLDVDDQVKAWDDPADNRIPERARLVGYRVLEDALSNVQKHAGARSVTVRISADPGTRALRIAVTDDGRGFDRAKLEPKLGLSAIAARVSTVGGRWEIKSRPDAGTTLAVELPLDPPTAADEVAAVRDAATGILTREPFESLPGSLLEQAEPEPDPAKPAPDRGEAPR